jgi:hypothetical protein
LGKGGFGFYLPDCVNRGFHGKTSLRYPTHFDIPAYSYKFTSDGDCFYYFHELQVTDTIRKLFDFDDVIVTNKWKFQNDSTINILGWDYLYRFIGSDTIVLIFSKRKSDSTVIVASKMHVHE